MFAYLACSVMHENFNLHDVQVAKYCMVGTTYAHCITSCTYSVKTSVK